MPTKRRAVGSGAYRTMTGIMIVERPKPLAVPTPEARRVSMQSSMNCVKEMPPFRAVAGAEVRTNTSFSGIEGCMRRWFFRVRSCFLLLLSGSLCCGAFCRVEGRENAYGFPFSCFSLSRNLSSIREKVLAEYRLSTLCRAASPYSERRPGSLRSFSTCWAASLMLPAR